MTSKISTVGIFTLGCKVNQYESEAICELFEENGFTVLSPNEACDVYVINTCTVTSESDRKARQTIRRAISKNPSAYVLVTGCLAETDPGSITKIENVDYVCGNADKSKIVAAAIELVNSGKKNDSPVSDITDISDAPFECMKIKKFNRTRAYIKIEDGCESHCTYCIIPKARGKIRSKLPSDVLAEITELTNGGCREVVLTGIETGSYRHGKYGLIDLLEDADKIENVGRIRLGSLDPSIMKDDFISRASKLKSLTPHFHISMQSGSDRVLALMKRKYNSSQALKAMQKLREAIPNVMFTTDMIVGFPGETEEMFNETVEFVKKARFLNIHVFPYSKRSGTPAAEMPNQISTAVKHERVLRLSEIEDEIRREMLEEVIEKTKTAEVLFEDFEKGFAYGHTDNFIEIKIPSDRQRHAELEAVRLKSTDGKTITAETL